MTSAPEKPVRDPVVIFAAQEKAQGVISRMLIAAMSDRGGTPADVAELLARVNAVVLLTLTDGQPDAHAKIDALIELVTTHCRKVCKRVATMEMLAKTGPVKGRRR